MSLDQSTQRPSPSPSVDRFIGDAEEKAITDLSRTTRWRLERAGKYQISPNRRARLLSEVTTWMIQAQRGEAA
jgi:hypothetical protein